MSRVSLRLSLLLSAPVWCAFFGGARADCVPAGTTGATVTCSGTGLPAFVAATGVTNLKVNVVGGASITGFAQTATGTNGQFSNVQVNDFSTITNNGTIANSASLQRDNVAVNLNGTNTTFLNNGAVTATDSAANASTTRRLYGVISSAPDGGPTDFANVSVVNKGTITVTQNGAAVARGVYAGENMDSMSIENFGTISVTRTSSVANNAATTQVAGIDADDDTDSLSVINHKGATIIATGANAYAVGGRAQDYEISNDGTITRAGILGTIGANPGINAAILVYGPGSVDVTNTGTINGDVYITELTPISANPRTPGAGLAGTDISRDSTFANTGTVNGSFFYGLGTHTLDNADTGKINGTITVDQTPLNTSAATAAVPAGLVAPGGRSFTFTNEGTMVGDITIKDVVGSVNSITLSDTGFAGNIVAVNGTGSNSLVLDGVTTLASVQKFSALDLTTSNVTVTGGVSLVNGSTLKTTIFGPGGTAAAPSTNAGSIFGTLTLAGTTTVTPTFAAIVHTGDTYVIASTLAPGGTVVAGPGTALVTSSVSRSASNQLLLQTTVADPRATAGISRAGGATLAGLLSYTGTNAQIQTLGAAVQSLPTADGVRLAGERLRPAVNGSAVQVPIAVASLFQTQVDTRLDSLLYAQLPSSGRSADLGPAHPPIVEPVRYENGVWASGIEGGIAQQAVGPVGGYTAKASGVIGGYDRLVMPGLRVGGAFGFVQTDVHDNQVIANTTGIQTYQGLVYAAVEQPTWYARGSAAYGGLDYKSRRTIAFPGFADTAVGNHGGTLFSGRVEGGYPIAIASAIVTPYASFTYAHVQQSGYSETSNFGAGLTYQGVSNDSERTAVGAKAFIPIATIPAVAFLAEGAAVALEVRGAYVHEFGNVAQNVTAGFVGAGNVFLANGPNPQRDMVDFGAGINLATDEAILSLSYNAVARSTYLEQVGLFKAKYVF